MSCAAGLSISKLITQLSNTKKSLITFEEFKSELERKQTNGDPIYYLNIKEDEELFMVYYNNLPDVIGRKEYPNLEKNCRSVILEKKTMKPIASQYNKILYNDETVEFLKGKNWKNVVVQKCVEGTLLLVFFHGKKWYVATRRCLDAKESSWVKGQSYYDMFLDAVKGKIDLNKLNKKFCYHFVLVHHKNKNIVSYNWLGKDYKEVFHIMTTEKYTLNEVVSEVPGARYLEEMKFKHIGEVLKELGNMDTYQKKSKKITLEGYVLKYYAGPVHKSNFVLMKLQTKTYEMIMKVKPNNSNIYQCFLELYQRDELNAFLPFFTLYGKEIMGRIHTSMQNMAKEVLDLYHMTRKQKSTQLYEQLTGQYKATLFKLHGIYIESRRSEFSKSSQSIQTQQNSLQSNGIKETKANDTQPMEPSTTVQSNQPDKLDLGYAHTEGGAIKSINVYNVYNFLKKLPPNELRQLYFDRTLLINNEMATFINKNCVHTAAQASMMFK